MTQTLCAAQALQVSPAQLALVRTLLLRHLPGLLVQAFGSRVNGWGTTPGPLKPHADLDLAIAGRPDARALAALRLDFDDSDLPWRVDLCLLDELPPPLRERIALNGCPL